MVDSPKKIDFKMTSYNSIPYVHQKKIRILCSEYFENSKNTFYHPFYAAKIRIVSIALRIRKTIFELK